MGGPTRNLGPIGSAGLTFIGCKPTDKQIDRQEIQIIYTNIRDNFRIHMFFDSTRFVKIKLFYFDFEFMEAWNSKKNISDE